MTEGPPILEYRKTEYDRRPIFIVLAILLIVFGAVGILGSGMSAFDMLARLSIRQPVWKLMLDSMVGSMISAASMVFLVAAGIAYLIRSRRVAGLLWMYFLITLCSAVVSPGLATWSQFGLPGSRAGYDVLRTTLYSTVSFPHAVIDVVLLMLLRTPAVKEIIWNVTGVDEA